jgi:hypothetical protein
MEWGDAGRSCKGCPDWMICEPISQLLDQIIEEAYKMVHEEAESERQEP